MTKAMFGIASALALVMAPAWAGDEDETATSDTVAESKGEGKIVTVEESSTRGVEAGRDSATMKESDEVRASHANQGAMDSARWLREREGYRDGGY
jgi:hypothetical protein